MIDDTAMLVILEGPEKGTVFKLSKRSLTIGREKGNLIQFVSRGISRRHVMIKWTGEGYRLIDLNSTNGAFVNGDRVAGEVNLALGDEIKIGDVRLAMVADTREATDATFSRPKVVSPALIGVKTILVDTGEQPPAPAPEPEPEPEPLPQPRVVDLDGLQRVDTSELEFAMFQIETDDDYLQVAFRTISSHIAPDRAFIFLITPERKARKVASWCQPLLSPVAADTAPALQLLARTIHGGRSQLENDVAATGDGAGKVATAAAVAFEGGAGALYLDSLLPHKKVFLSTDIKLLQTIGAALGPRLRG